MLFEFSDARANLLAQRRQVTAQRRRRANSIGTRGPAGRSLGGVEDFAAVAISDDPARDQLRLAIGSHRGREYEQRCCENAYVCADL